MNVMQPFLMAPIAHRTLHDKNVGVPENSWEGLSAALAKEVAIEIDIQMSKDGIPMVFHDYELDRVTHESGLINDFDAADLIEMPLKHGTKTIPRLDEFMQNVAGKVPVLLELKDQSRDLGPVGGALEKPVCDILNAYSGASAVMSFNPHMVYKCKKHAPNIPRGLVTDAFREVNWPKVGEARRLELVEIPDFEATGSHFISHNRNDLNSIHLVPFKDRGVPIFCWTVRSEEQEAEARNVAENITFEGYFPAGIS